MPYEFVMSVQTALIRLNLVVNILTGALTRLFSLLETSAWNGNNR